MYRILLWLIAIFITATSYAETSTFTLHTNAFSNQGTLPVLYTCNGKDISPELDWANLPEKTKTLTLILSDRDAPNSPFYHWILYNIPKSVTTLPEGISTLPDDTNVGKNSWNNPQYNGPCPQKQSIHTYFFTLYALDTKLDIKPMADGKAVMTAMQKHILGKAVLSTVYTQWP